MKLLRIALVLAVSAWLGASLLYIITLSAIKGPSLSPQDRSALDKLRNDFRQCVESNGFGLRAEFKGSCLLTMSFPSDTIPKWKDPKTGDLEGLSYGFDLCETLLLWEQIRNTSTILTEEYIDALPNGWHDYAWKRINKGILLKNCENKSLCEEKLSLVLPRIPPFFPRQYGRCAIVGNSGDLIKMKLGKEIDQYDAVVRNNGAPVENYTDYVGRKTTFRLLNRGSAKALDKVAALDGSGKEVLIIKTTIHDIMSKMIKDVPILNPVYLMLGSSLGSSAKGTGLKAVEFALSVCESVDIYGFTVDPGYTEWTRYFSESRGGHTPLQGRAYYQMMECLGLITIHSPLREARGHEPRDIPDMVTLEKARLAMDRLLGQGSGNPFDLCMLWRRRKTRAEIPYSEAAMKHFFALGGATLYPLDHSNFKGNRIMITVMGTQRKAS
ncbi:hypothetical protein GOP47_0000368 [Adiantum capillus-veneris]|uniref:Sialyltransferase-like protein 2 n=1 Tax=Adiantum capillus-veneris TaxID=13818 RepID=A0A9D4VDS2_ADICA|nr:hypothetical protein GOP47_0000368 [Adiantum capillus-veneris]